MRPTVFALALAILATPQASLRPGNPQSPERGPTSRAFDERRLDLPIVGASTVYVPRTPTSRVVLFLSGDGGWNLGVVDMARRMASEAIVVGVSVPALVRAAARATGCWYPAGDLETLAHAAEKRLGLPDYHAPVLVGYSSGATLVYAALTPAPPNTFGGGISLGFCADLDLARPVCRASGWSPQYDPLKHLSWLPRVTALPRPWYVLHGTQDQVCPPADARRFTDGMANAHLVEIGGTGHGFSRPARWGPSFDAALAAIWKADEPVARPRPQSLTLAAIEGRLDKLGLPLEYRWPAHEPIAYVIFFSGDGGWAALDEAVASNLAARGIAVVGVSSLRYFWRAKTPAQVGDLLRSLVAALGKPVFAGGYSFGAEVVPVALREARSSGRVAVNGLVLVGPGPSASFEIDPLDWVRAPATNSATRVGTAVRETGLPTLCVMGADEEDSGCHSLGNAALVRVETLPGAHHFDGRYSAVAGLIASFVESGSTGGQHTDLGRPPRGASRR
jgi:type IV secretory pathway VirJ component